MRVIDSAHWLAVSQRWEAAGRAGNRVGTRGRCCGIAGHSSDAKVGRRATLRLKLSRPFCLITVAPGRVVTEVRLARPGTEHQVDGFVGKWLTSLEESPEE